METFFQMIFLMILKAKNCFKCVLWKL